MAKFADARCADIDMDRTPDGKPPPADGAPQCTLGRVAAEAAPFRELLAPWDRARLRLTCRALAAAVPAGSCAATLAAMVRTPGGGAALLRYGAGDARPVAAHCLLAVVHDADDALRWLLLSCDVVSIFGPHHMRTLRRMALRSGSVAILNGVCARAPAADLVEDLGAACLKDRELLATERAAEVVALLVPRSACAMPNGPCWQRLDAVLGWAIRKNMPAALDPFLALLGAHGGAAVPDAFATSVRCAALATGRRQAVEPCDWGRVEPRRLFRWALYGGEPDLAEEAWSRKRRPNYDLLYNVMCARRNAYAALDRALVYARRPLSRYEARQHDMTVVVHDAVDALRWLSERAGYVPDAELLTWACRQDAVRCASYIAERCGVQPTATMLVEALMENSYRVAAAIGPRVTGCIEASDLKRLLRRVYVRWKSGHDARALALLRRLALLPAPDVPFLRALLHGDGDRDEEDACGLPMLVLAGYRVDADRRTWTDAVASHCAGVPPDGWRPLADELYDRCRRNGAGIWRPTACVSAHG